jgi:hypothetical protein
MADEAVMNKLQSLKIPPFVHLRSFIGFRLCATLYVNLKKP